MPAGFSTSPCLSRWTMVVSDIARPAYPVMAGLFLPQRVADLPGHVAGVVTHDERGETQHAIAAQGEIVVAVHVRPVLGRVHVMDAVYLDDEPGGLPHGVEPPAAAAANRAAAPAGRARAAGAAEQPGEVQLGKRLRAARDVIERGLDHRPARQPLVPRHDRRQVRDPDEPLLHPRGQHCLRARGRWPSTPPRPPVTARSASAAAAAADECRPPSRRE